jgi:hypothetical protein
MSRRTTIFACTLSFTLGAAAMWAQSQQSATRREPQFENSEVKVWKSIIMPNQPLTQHRHEHGRALIALTDGEVKVVGADGKTMSTMKWEQGKAYWLDADPPVVTHADVSSMTKPIEVIVVELKNDKK